MVSSLTITSKDQRVALREALLGARTIGSADVSLPPPRSSKARDQMRGPSGLGEYRDRYKD